MKKNVIGFALFVSIIGISIFTYSFFKTEWVPLEVPPVHLTENSGATYLANTVTVRNEIPTVTFKLQDAVLDLEKNTLTTKVQFTWDGKGKPPTSAAFKVAFFTASEPNKKINVSSEFAMVPFNGNTTVTRTFVSTVIVAPNTFNSDENFYAFADDRSYQTFERFDQTVQGVFYRIPVSEEDRLGTAVPVTFVFPK